MIMLKKNLFLIFGIVLLSVACQPEKQTSIDWKPIEMSMPALDKKILVLSLNDPLINGMINASPDTTILDLFHFLDLNADGKTDVVFNGFAGAADEFVLIFLQQSSGWQKAVHQYGHVQKIHTGPDALLEIYRKEAVGENGGDSVLTYTFIDSAFVRTNAVSK